MLLPKWDFETFDIEFTLAKQISRFGQGLAKMRRARPSEVFPTILLHTGLIPICGGPALGSWIISGQF